jgi:hypothetical protein
MVKDAAKANYLLWRKFMILYHFKTRSGDNRKIRTTNLGYIVSPMKKFVSHNRNYRKAYDTMRVLDSDIRESVLELLRRECSDMQERERGIEYLLDISENLFYGYMDYQGCNRHKASLFQSHYYYLVVNLLLKYGLDNRDFDSDWKPSDRLLTIFSRLFNESIVHRPKGSLIEKCGQIEKAFEVIAEGTYSVEDYTFA